MVQKCLVCLDLSFAEVRFPLVLNHCRFSDKILAPFYPNTRAKLIWQFYEGYRRRWDQRKWTSIS